MTTPNNLYDPAIHSYEPQLGRNGQPDDEITGTTPKATLEAIGRGEHLDRSVQVQLGLVQEEGAQPARPAAAPAPAPAPAPQPAPQP